MTIVDSIDTSDVALIGVPFNNFDNSPTQSMLASWKSFRNRNSLRVFERGVGETPCGTACSAVTYGRFLGRLGPKVTVATRAETCRLRRRSGVI